METTIYTEDEKQLLDLIDWTTNYMNNFPFTNNTDKETAEAYKKAYSKVKELVLKSASSRTIQLQNIKDEDDRALTKQKSVRCLKCNTISNVKPSGTMQNKYGLTCGAYICNNCKVEFSDWVPLNIHDKIKFGEIMLEKMIKDKLPQKRIEEIRASNKQLSEAVLAVDKEREKIYALHKTLEKYVDDRLVELFAYKLKVLFGNTSKQLN